jgi:hypothetical protein
MRRITNNFYRYALGSAVLLVMLYACRKHFVHHEDYTYQNTYKAFFDVTGVTNNAVLDIAANVKKQEAQMHFVQPFSRRDGFIRWKDAMVITKEQQDIVLLPFAKQGATEITGYIQAQKLPNNIGYTYEFFRTKNLKNYDFTNKNNRLNGTLADIIINSFNHTLYNKTVFAIPHKNVLPKEVLEQYGNNIDITKLTRVALTEQAYHNYNSMFRVQPIQAVCTGHYEWHGIYDNGTLVGLSQICVADPSAVIVVGVIPSSGGGGGSGTINPGGYPYWGQYGGGGSGGAGSNNPNNPSYGGGASGAGSNNPNDPNNPLTGGGGGYTNPYPAGTNCGYQPVPATDPNGMQPVQPVATVYYGGDPNGWQQCDNGNINVTPLPIISYDSTFTNSKSKCTIDSLKLRSPFFNSLLNTFDGIDGNRLTFKLADTSQIYALGGNYYDHAVTSFGNNDTSFIIGIAYATDSASNLFRMISLAHELIHARMFYSLRKAGYLKIDSVGNIQLDTTGVNTFVDISTIINENERFRILAKTYINNIPPASMTIAAPYNWTHELFNTATFDTETYRKKLEQMILDAGKLNTQNATFVNQCSSPIFATGLFGFNLTAPNTWQSQVASYTSYAGLQGTPGFNIFLTNQGISEVQFNTFLDILKYTPNKNCE